MEKKKKETNKSQPLFDRLTAKEKTLYRTFQSNLVSLISHELRTPLTGVLNALSLLKEEKHSLEFEQELLSMTYRNAQRLEQTLASLLDLSRIENHVIQLHFKEINFARLVMFGFRDFQNQVVEHKKKENNWQPVLADPIRLGRVLELLNIIFKDWAQEEKEKIKITVSDFKLTCTVPLKKEILSQWKKTWEHAEKISLKDLSDQEASSFLQALQQEHVFLSRSVEGLGIELLLAHEIIKRHRGNFRYSKVGTNQIEIEIELPQYQSEEGLKLVVQARAYEASNGVSSLAIGMIEIPKEMDFEDFAYKIRKQIFRSTDAVYLLPESKKLALVMNDCQPKDAPFLIKRVQKGVGVIFRIGMVHCPEDSSDPEVLMKLLRDRLQDQ